MSKHTNKFTAAPVPATASATIESPFVFASADAAQPTKPMTLTGVVRTTRGYAVATATIDLDGKLAVKLGYSQSEKQFVAHEHAKGLARLANSIG